MRMRGGGQSGQSSSDSSGDRGVLFPQPREIQLLNSKQHLWLDTSHVFDGDTRII